MSINRDIDVTPGDTIEFAVEPNAPLIVALAGAYRGPLTTVAPEFAWRALVEETPAGDDGCRRSISTDPFPTRSNGA